MTAPRIMFAGDIHGELRHVLRLAQRHRPDAVIFLGDLELPAPLTTVMRPLVDAGVAVHGIHGNHDVDSAAFWGRLTDDPAYSTFNLDGRVVTVAGVRIAGLGGVFHPKVWYPPDSSSCSSYVELESVLEASYQRDEQAKLRAQGMRLRHHASIFPDVYERLASLEADVLVTHEAPGADDLHPLGFEAIDELAQMMGASRGFHGHHHETRRYRAKSPVRWFGVGYREIMDLNGDLVSGLV